MKNAKSLQQGNSGEISLQEVAQRALLGRIGCEIAAISVSQDETTLDLVVYADAAIEDPQKRALEDALDEIVRFAIPSRARHLFVIRGAHSPFYTQNGTWVFLRLGQTILPSDPAESLPPSTG